MTTDLRNRIRAIEQQLTAGTDAVEIFIDDEPTLALTGFTVCSVNGGVDIDRLPGEAIPDLKDRCRAENAKIRRENSFERLTAGTIFLPIYDYDKKRTQYEQT